MVTTITCECGKVLEISPYLNENLQLICDDLAAKLAVAEATVVDVRKERDNLTMVLRDTRQRLAAAEAADTEALDSLWKMTNRCNDWRDRYILLERAVMNYIRAPEGCGQEEYKALEQTVSIGDKP